MAWWGKEMGAKRGEKGGDKGKWGLGKGLNGRSGFAYFTGEAGGGGGGEKAARNTVRSETYRVRPALGGSFWGGMKARMEERIRLTDQIKKKAQKEGAILGRGASFR